MVVRPKQSWGALGEPCFQLIYISQRFPQAEKDQRSDFNLLGGISRGESHDGKQSHMRRRGPKAEPPGTTILLRERGEMATESEQN